jgi:hypothetical protein
LGGAIRKCGKRGQGRRRRRKNQQIDICIAAYTFNILFSVLLITYNLSFL